MLLTSDLSFWWLLPTTYFSSSLTSISLSFWDVQRVESKSGSHILTFCSPVLFFISVPFAPIHSTAYWQTGIGNSWRTGGAFRCWEWKELAKLALSSSHFCYFHFSSLSNLPELHCSDALGFQSNRTAWEVQQTAARFYTFTSANGRVLMMNLYCFLVRNLIFHGLPCQRFQGRVSKHFILHRMKSIFFYEAFSVYNLTSFFLFSFLKTLLGKLSLRTSPNP